MKGSVLGSFAQAARSAVKFKHEKGKFSSRRFSGKNHHRAGLRSICAAQIARALTVAQGQHEPVVIKTGTRFSLMIVIKLGKYPNF